jgi:hypothetical protein
MTTSNLHPGERVKDVRVSDDLLHVDLLDGRSISVPLVWYPRLLHATPEQRGRLARLWGWVWYSLARRR